MHVTVIQADVIFDLGPVHPPEVGDVGAVGAADLVAAGFVVLVIVRRDPYLDPRGHRGVDIEGREHAAAAPDVIHHRGRTNTANRSLGRMIRQSEILNFHELPGARGRTDPLHAPFALKLELRIWRAYRPS